MLEDLGKLGPVEQTIASARQVTTFLYAHTRVLDLMRKFLGKDLVRSGVTRFATAYLNLKSLLDNKKDLTRLFRSDELNDLGYLKKAKGKKANKVVRSEAFWKNVDMAVNFFEPLANVLRRMDSDVPAMGFLHGCMLEAKKEIAMRFDNDENSFKVAWDFIDKSSSVCERNWSVFEQVHTKKRNRLLHDRMRDLVFVKFNSILKLKKENKSRDPILKELNDVLEDDRNEFVTGVVPNANGGQEGDHEVTQVQGGASMSQEQAKRKRPVRPVKKKIRSLQSLMRDVSEPAASASSESEDNQDGDILMQVQSSDSADSEDE
ncbi:hypothetical protein E2562_022147 [Oryza meyeriana var. granulata]|uniref:HAT C-terminal dimerisation domain-containing protein n=1 Tax=Oryza meyeriana var. granulata TaxID=110450 RepID=A0A6G1DLQ8_9ORYZ|nr:hypothetical protein E2562_022147 [Oryza meyeriana var. granulata]